MRPKAADTGMLAPFALTAVLFSRAALADEDIHELRGPKTVLAGWPLLAIAATILALVLALAGYLVWRRRRAATLPVATPAQAALAGLEAARSLLTAARAREFCDAASDVVRHYIEAQFALTAQQRTTEEFLQQLSTLPASPLATHQARLSEFLQHADFVRFSGTAADAASLEALYQAARSFVIDSSVAPHDQVPAT